MAKIAKGTWVEIEQVVLTPDQRVQTLPEETRSVPYRITRFRVFTAGCEIGRGSPGKNDHRQDARRDVENG